MRPRASPQLRRPVRRSAALPTAPPGPPPPGQDSGVIDPAVQDEGHGAGEGLGGGQAPPDLVRGDKGEDQADGQHNDRLAQYRENQAEQGYAQGLEGGAQDDGHTGKQEGEGDNPQGRDTHGHDRFGRTEDLHELLGEEQENHHAHTHDAQGRRQGKVDAPGDPLLVPGAVVVAENGGKAVVHAVDRHKDKGLELEVGREDKHRGVAVQRQHPGQTENFVQAQGHHGA